MQKTNIPWTEYTWNPLTGCPLPLVSSGCSRCYARSLHNKRHEAYKAGKKLPIQYAKPFEEIQLFSDRLNEPLHKRNPCKIFVGSMTDLFRAPAEFLIKVLNVISGCKDHTFQVLTKQHKRMQVAMQEYYRILELIPKKFGTQIPLPNLHLGVTVCNQIEKHKIDTLRQIPAAVRFISIEPCLADMGELDLTGIHQVILGGESGPGARPMHPDWARSVRDQCKAAGVPFFFKQWGEWLPLGQHPMAMTAKLINREKRMYELSDGFYGKPTLKGAMEHIDKDGTFPGKYVNEPVYRVGKKKAGHLLDGKEYREKPK